MMNVVVPFSRPEKFERVISMWAKQTAPMQLLLVANGEAAKVEFPRVDGVTIITGQASAGGARNSGMAYLRVRGIPWAAFWDDDNYYSPRYLEQFVEAAPSCDVITRGLGFVRWDKDLWAFRGKLGFFPGHSTAVRVRVAPDFPEISGGEELPWSEKLIRRGARVANLEPWHLVYDRTDGCHAYDASEAEFLRAFGPASPLGEQPDSFVDEIKPIDVAPITASDDAVFRSLEARLWKPRHARQ